MKARVFRYALRCFIVILTGSILGSGHADETPVPSALPDLTVSEIHTHIDWTPATVESSEFTGAFQSTLRAIAVSAHARIFVVRPLPGVNYLLLHCMPDYPVNPSATDAEMPPDALRQTEGFRETAEHVRQAIRQLPYVEFCAYNPVDTRRPDPIVWAANMPRPEPRLSPEVVPGELVVGFTGGPVPLLRIHAALAAGNDAWQGRTQVRTALTRRNSSDTPPTAVSVCPVVFRGGSAETGVAFLAMPGAVVCSVEIDPENGIEERDESNNTRRVPVEIPPILFRLGAGPTGIDTAQNATPVHGVLEVANVSPEPVRFPYTVVQFHLDGAPVRVVWRVELPTDSSGTGEGNAAPAPVLVMPGEVRALPFVLDATLGPGEHILRADLDEFALHCEAHFRTGPPPPTDNLAPLPDAASIAPVRIEPTASDPNIHVLLENEAWLAFGDVPVLAGVEVVPSPVMVDQPSRTSDMPIRLWDLEIVLHFRPDIDSQAERVRELAERLTHQWYIEDAWSQPVAWNSLGNEPTRNLPESNLLPDPGVPWRVAVKLATAATPRSVLRVRLPVERVTGEATPISTRPPPLPVVVQFSAQLLPPPAPREEDAPVAALIYRAAIPLFHVGRLPAVGFLSVPAGTDNQVTATVDPDNRIPEVNEQDNDCEITGGGGQGEVKFHAEASIDWTSPDAARRPELRLTVHGTLLNDGNAGLVLEFPTSLQMDFAWGDRYRWSEGRGFLQVITRVEIPAGGQHTWEISVPVREVWRAVIPASLGPDRESRLPEFVLRVELVGTDFQDEAPVRMPDGQPLLDDNNDLLPDAWVEAFLGTTNGEAPASGGPLTEDDPDGDGWNNLLEFLHGTNPADPDDLPDGRLFQLHLFPGWNLISLPVAPEDPAPHALFGDTILGDVWKWATPQDAPNGEYLPAEQIAPHAAYWVFARAAVDLSVPGVPHQAARLQLHAGWTLSGAGGPLRPAKSTQAALAVWRWDAEHQRYAPVPDGLMEEGAGYWISSPEAVDFNLTGQ